MANREFLQLAQTYKPGKSQIADWFVSTKLDGMRAWWDGGVTRGLPVAQVPWANRTKDQRDHISTGLWSRYGKPIFAPDYWLDRLPPVSLDGELYLGVGKFQRTVSITKDHVPGEGWRDIKFCVFDAPPAHAVCQDGRLNSPHFQGDFTGLWDKVAAQFQHCSRVPEQYQDVQNFLGQLDVNETLQILPQQRLPDKEWLAHERVEELLYETCAAGGEGLMLRDPRSLWTPKRTYKLLKVKKLTDDEGIVVGCTFGRETDKGSKLLGKMGALLLKFNGKVFELSGFTDAERELSESAVNRDVWDQTAEEYAAAHPGKPAPPWIYPKHFPLGAKVSFKYRELTDSGLPKEARFWRKA